MKKILLILFILSTLLSLTSCNNKVEELPRKYYSTGSVFSGSINTQDSFVGYIEGKQTVNLAPKLGGRISDIYIKEGDYVKEGDILVKLDSLEAKVGYGTADSIINSLNSLKKSTAMMFDKQILAMEYKVEQAKIGEKGIKQGLGDKIIISNTQLETAKTGIETAKANLDHTKIVLETKKIHIYENLENAIVGSVILDTNIINYIDSLLGITEANKKKNDIFEDYLSAKNTIYLKEAENKFLEVNKLYLEYKLFYDNEIDGKKPSKETVLKGLNDGELLAGKLKSLLSSVYNVLDNSIENIYFSLETINNYKKTTSDFGNYIESSLLTVSGEYTLGLKGSRQSLDDFEKSSGMQINLLEKQLELAENTYAQYKAMTEGQITEVETEKEVTSSQLNEIIAGLSALKKQKETALKEIDTKISEAKGEQNSAGVMIEAGIIRSPINGIIISNNAKLGQVISSGMPILTVSNDDNLEINITVSDEQYNNIALGDLALLEVAGLDKQIFGKITNILSSRDLITKKIPIEISLENIGKKIKIGSYTKIIFNNSGSNNGTIISNSAIISKFMIPGVYVLNNNIVEFKNIKILKQNDNFSEINGLNIGEIVIIDGKENIWDGEKLN